MIYLVAQLLLTFFQEPVIRLPAVINGRRELVLWTQSIIHRKDRNAKIVGPHPSVVLMAARAHRDKTSSMEMKDGDS